MYGPMSRIQTLFLCVAIGGTVCICGLNAPSTARGDNIDRQLLRHTPKVMNYLKQKGYKNVGVLTFRVQRDGKKPTMRGSLMNNNMAERMENALMLTIDPENPVNVIRNARNTAGAKLTNASYRTPSSRKRLFDVTYQLPIQVPNRSVAADAFVTGKVNVSRDYRTTTITLEAFDKKRPQVYTKVLDFGVDTDRYILADLGQGFSLSRRGVRFMRSAIDENDIVKTVDEEKEDASKGDPRTEADYPEPFPVELTIRYDEEAQLIESDSSAGPNNWTVPDPKEGQDVVFDLKNNTDEKLGVAITVNGISTLYEERVGPDQLTHWILAPRGKYRLRGFYNEDNVTYKPIVGLSDEFSESMFEDLGGEHVAGLIHLYVFREQDGIAASGAPGVSRGSLRWVPPSQVKRRNPRSWGEMQKHIAATMSMQAKRGLMAAVPESKEQALTFDQLPEVNLTDMMFIRYYRPSQTVADAEQQ